MDVLKETLLQFCLTALMVFHFEIMIKIAYNESLFNAPVCAVIVILINCIVAGYLTNRLIK
jgi:hypothetical protein